MVLPDAGEKMVAHALTGIEQAHVNYYQKWL